MTDKEKQINEVEDESMEKVSGGIIICSVESDLGLPSNTNEESDSFDHHKDDRDRFI